ncbi:hypothetical protein R4282_16695 [Rhodococcus oxybenzonivorans]|uniref:hypothetical protein n=1 Tax=Rhodococcus TaxID=1827 RepID=UPI0013204F66|nr:MULTISPECIES: hypothetical protein [Rhodococcus]MDV7354638.1 hypothetical protein [Rhodococcus oxybenzonivorans]QHE70907.1 hypothetical protein GFS60_04500 [Rhodococcus sp. WAY2]
MTGAPHTSDLRPPVPLPTSREAFLTAQVQSYRQHRRKQQATAAAATRRTYTHHEGAEIIRFAEVWAPYGGPPGDEVFVRFGITTAEFRVRLHDVLRQCSDPDTTRRLTAAYHVA